MDTVLAFTTHWGFLDNLQEGIIFMENDGSILFANSAAKQLVNSPTTPTTLYDLYTHLAPTEKWGYWEELLKAPSESLLKTSVGYLEAKTRPVFIQTQTVVQLILTPTLPELTGPQTDLHHQLLALREENQQLLYQVEQAKRLEIISEASRLIASSPDEKGILNVLGEYMVRTIKGIGYTIYSWSADKKAGQVVVDTVLHPQAHSPNGEVKFEVAEFNLLGQLFDDNTLLVTQLRYEDPAVLPGRPVWLSPNKEYTLTLLPIFSGGEPYGAIILATPGHSGDLNENEMQLLAALLNQAGVALEKVRLFNDTVQLVTSLRTLNEELDHRVAERTQALGAERDRFQVLLRITTELSSSLDEEHILNRALELVNEEVHATQGMVLITDSQAEGEAANEFVYRAVFGMAKPIGQRTGMHLNEGLAGWVFINGEAVLVQDTADDPRWIDRPSSRKYRSVIAAPLMFSGEVIGVFLLFHVDPHAFTEQQLNLVKATASQVSNALYNAHLYMLIRNQAERLGDMLREEQVSNAKMQGMMESIADGVLVANQTGEIIVANIATSKILGIPRAELIGKNVRQLSGLYGYSGDLWVRTIQDWASNSEMIAGESYLADELKIDDKIVSVLLSPIFANQQFFGTVSIVRDRTKEVEVDRVKSEFVSTVSHELRTPLTSIKGYTDLILMGATGPIPESQTKYLRVIKSNADRLQELVNDLLDISRIETGKTKLDLRPVDLSQVIHEVVEGHLVGRVKHENKVITSHIELPPNLPLANGDYKRVTQILTNLVDNAFNYTESGGSITVKAWSEKGQIYISVKDTGYGISEENLNKIFDRFYRSEDERIQKVSGTGLGLAIVTSLIEMHGGRLQVQSKLNEGSTFTFNLPIVKKDVLTT